MPRPRQRPVPPDPEGQNDDRASWAQEAIAAFMDATNTEREDVVSDLICDLKHWCDRQGISFMRELRRAEAHYREETMDPEVFATSNENNQQAEPAGTAGEGDLREPPF